MTLYVCGGGVLHSTHTCPRTPGLFSQLLGPPLPAPLTSIWCGHTHCCISSLQLELPGCQHRPFAHMLSALFLLSVRGRSEHVSAEHLRPRPRRPMTMTSGMHTRAPGALTCCGQCGAPMGLHPSARKGRLEGLFAELLLRGQNVKAAQTGAEQDIVLPASRTLFWDLGEAGVLSHCRIRGPRLFC